MKPGVLLAGAALAAVFVVSLTVLAGGTGEDASSSGVVPIAQAAATACSVDGPVPGLGAQEAANAGAVVSAAIAASGDDTRAAQEAVTAALAVSGLTNPVNAAAGPVGLYQERPSSSWGTSAQLMSPPLATATFVTHLLEVPGGQQMAPWVAAQAAELPAAPPVAALRANWPVRAR